jgi:hypothetical protein
LHRNPEKRALLRPQLSGIGVAFTITRLREIGMVEIESQWTAQDHQTKTSGGPERVFFIPEPALSEAEELAPKERARPWRTPLFSVLTATSFRFMLLANGTFSFRSRS